MRKRLMRSQPAQNVAIRVAIDLDIFKTLSAEDAAPKTSAQLAAPKYADPLLVGECKILCEWRSCKILIPF